MLTRRQLGKLFCVKLVKRLNNKSKKKTKKVSILGDVALYQEIYNWSLSTNNWSKKEKTQWCSVWTLRSSLWSSSWSRRQESLVTGDPGPSRWFAGGTIDSSDSGIRQATLTPQKSCHKRSNLNREASDTMNSISESEKAETSRRTRTYVATTENTNQFDSVFSWTSYYLH